ncbi:MAG: phage tail family protein [Clostridia bacterium]|nr:phage tail family protein [Clostridia bacterium]
MPNSFTFGEHSTLDFGLIVGKKNIYKTPVRNISFVSVPGRSGDVIMDDGSYPNIEISYTVGQKDIKTPFSDVAAWLSSPGYQKLMDTYTPDVFRLAVCTSGQEWDEQLQNFGEAAITFNCKPFRYLVSGELATTLTSGGTLINPTSFDSLPYIKITGSGNVTLHVNNKSYSLTSISPNIEIDSEMMAVYRGATLLNNKASFDEFPVLSAGENTISWTGTVSKVEIIPRWRVL